MHKPTHWVGGLVAGQLSAAYLSGVGNGPDSAVNAGLMVAGGAVGGTLPDLDVKISFLKHRGFSHTLWAALIIGAGGIFLYLLTGIPQMLPFMIGVFNGYIAHLFLDSQTVSGIYWVRLYHRELRDKRKEYKERREAGSTARWENIYWERLHMFNWKGPIVTSGSRKAFQFLFKKSKVKMRDIMNWSGDWDKKEALWFAALMIIAFALGVQILSRLLLGISSV